MRTLLPLALLIACSGPAQTSNLHDVSMEVGSDATPAGPGPESTTDVATLPEPATPAAMPSGAPTATSGADPCASLDGLTYTAEQPDECGRGASCRWTLNFEGGKVRWRWSDVVSSGAYTCRDGVITLNDSANNLPATATLADGGASLDWKGKRYLRGEAPSSPTTPTVSTPTLFTPTADADPRACATTADCLVTNIQDGSCCPTPCGNSAAYNATHLKQITARRDKLCAAARVHCPPVGCAWVDYHAECVAGQCTAVKGPF